MNVSKTGSVNKIEQTEGDLREHLKEQLHFLETSANNFDNGDDSESKRMAVHIRTLLHDTSNSQSLLGLLKVKESTLFTDSSSSQEGLIGPYEGLVMKSLGPKGGTYVAPLDDFPPDHTFKSIPFDDYWNNPIFVDHKGNRFSRKSVILAIANKDGGAHIDPELDQDYVEFTKQNSLGWVYDNAIETGSFGNASLAAIRQITHEILRTLIPDYPEKKFLNTHNSAVFGEIHLSDGFMPGRIVNIPAAPPEPQIRRKGPCPCGSGKKYKRCHGK